MQLASTSFLNGEIIPARHTCQGKDISPELHWIDPPENTKSFALIADDPDAPAGTWVHWVLYNIPANMKALAEGAVAGNGMRQGRNDFRNNSYGGPCPPHGHGSHRYFFKLYALDDVLNLEPGATKAVLQDAMKGHILAEAALMGRFERP